MAPRDMVLGDGREALGELLKAVEQGSGVGGDIPNLLRRGEDGQLASTTFRHQPLESIPPPSFDHFMGYRGIFEAGPDGSVWYDPADPDHALGCDGIANFDGTTVRHFLQDHCFYGGDIGPDGTVWVERREEDALPEDDRRRVGRPRPVGRTRAPVVGTRPRAAPPRRR